MRFSSPRFVFAAMILLVVAFAAPAHSTDKDGPADCQRAHEDFGDAPECIPAYPTGVIGKFPTCLFPCGAIGTFDISCPPISLPPGPTGFVHHISPPGGYWLGCYPDAFGAPSLGIDSEPDGKTNTPAVGISACVPGLPTDCVEAAFGMTFDQDECTGDGSDAGVVAPIAFVTCTPSTVTFTTSNCGPPRQVFLNICVDWNADGDWNDNFSCAPACAYEWAVKNVMIGLAPGCGVVTSPVFLAGPFVGPGWLRLTISDTPVPDDFPWNGSVSMPGSVVQGGETEDYPVQIGHQTPTQNSTWGRLKTIYR